MHIIINSHTIHKNKCMEKIYNYISTKSRFARIDVGHAPFRTPRRGPHGQCVSPFEHGFRAVVTGAALVHVTRSPCNQFFFWITQNLFWKNIYIYSSPRLRDNRSGTTLSLPLTWTISKSYSCKNGQLAVWGTYKIMHCKIVKLGLKLGVPSLWLNNLAELDWTSYCNS